jgi:hypothetical protein
MTRSDVLSKYGVSDHKDLRVRPVQEADTLWLVGINAPGDPVIALAPKKTAELSIELRRAGEDQLASDVLKAADQAKGANARRGASAT